METNCEMYECVKCKKEINIQKIDKCTKGCNSFKCPKCGADFTGGVTGEVNNKNQTVEGNGNGQVNTKTVKKNKNGN